MGTCLINNPISPSSLKYMRPVLSFPLKLYVLYISWHLTSLTNTGCQNYFCFVFICEKYRHHGIKKKKYSLKQPKAQIGIFHKIKIWIGSVINKILPEKKTLLDKYELIERWKIFFFTVWHLSTNKKLSSECVLIIMLVLRFYNSCIFYQTRRILFLSRFR